jgi:protease IV
MFYRTFRREAATIIFKAVITIVSIIFVFAFIDSWYNIETVSDGSCNIAVLPIEGVIMPFYGFDDYPLVITPGLVRDFVSKSEDDVNIKGLLLEINSPGGTPVAAEQISNYINNSSLPTVGLIGDVGASGAYLVAASTDTVIASAMSDVGSIGVTMSYLENTAKNEEEGISFVELTSGKYKEAGNPNRELSEEERALFEADLKLVHDEFVRQIAVLRNKSVDEIQALADGSSMPGIKALEKGLIDQIGNRTTAKEAFSAKLGLEVDEIVFCEYSPETFFY